MTQFHMTEMDLEVHPGLHSQAGEVGRATTTGSTAVDLVCNNLVPELGAQKSTSRDDGKLHNLRGDLKHQTGDSWRSGEDTQDTNT